MLNVQSEERSGCKEPDVIAGLAASIERDGLLNPLFVRNGIFKHEPSMRVAWGASRLRALKFLGGVRKIPVLVCGELPPELEGIELFSVEEVDSYLTGGAHYEPAGRKYASLEFVPVIRGARLIAQDYRLKVES
jgi:hypothetical protein